MKLNSRFILKVLTSIIFVFLVGITGNTRLSHGNESDFKSEDEKNRISEMIKNQVDELSNNNSIVTTDDNVHYELTTFESDVQIEKNNAWKAIDSTLVSDNEGNYVTKESKLDIKFSNNLHPQDAFIDIDNDSSQSVEFSLNSVQTEDGLYPIQKSEGEIFKNSITYPDILKDVDLRHIVLNNEIKEDIILHKPLKGLKSINYRLETNLIPTITDEGSLLLSDKKGKKVYEMPAPQMNDSKVEAGSGYSKLNHDIKYSLINKDTYYEVKLLLTSDWLEQDRTYPVYIDPTIIKNASLDTFVSSVAPDKGHNQYWNSTLGQYVLRVGKYDASTGTNYALVKLYSLASLEGANVTSATLKAFVNWSYYETTKTGLWVDKVASPWSENNVTWNTRPASTGIASTTVARNNWATFDVTNAVKEVVAGTRTDNGFKFHTNGNEATHWKQLSAGENGANITNLSVAYSYPQMQPLKSEPYPTSVGSTTGYIDLSWPIIKGATGYRLQLFDGKGWQTIYNGTSAFFTTKGKKLWPLSSQYSMRDSSTGGIKFRSGDGQELPMNPSPMYTTSSGIASSSKAFQFRVIADYKLGSSTPSAVTKPVLDGIIPDTPAAPRVNSTALDVTNENGFFSLEWDEVEGATSYDLQIFNGNNYESIPVGNTTKWTSQNQNIFPSPTQLTEVKIGDTTVFRLNKDGVNLGTDPRELYKLTGTTYANTTNYFVKIVAKSDKGTSSPSPYTRVWLPTTSPTTNHTGVNVNNSEAYIQSHWKSDEEVAGYIVSIFNGKNYQIVSRLDKDTKDWSSKNSKIWPLESQGIDLRTAGDGRELLIDPTVTYQKTDSENSNKNYQVKVQSFRSENTALSPYTYDRYRGLSSDEAIDEVSIFEQPIPKITVNHNVALNRSKMDSPNVKAYANGDGTGYLDVSWSPVENAKQYQVILFNGHQHMSWEVPATVTNWSTKDKKIYPTLAQLDSGKIDFQKDNTGQELVEEPSYLYKKSNEMNGGLDYSRSNNYYVYVTSQFEDGYTPVSDAAVGVIPVDDATTFISENVIVDSNGYVDEQLLQKGFSSEDLLEMPLELKEEILAGGGVFVNTETTNVEFSSTVSESDDTPVVIEGDSFDDIQSQVTPTASNYSAMSFTTAGLGDYSKWDKVVGAFRGKTYLTYIGKTSKEFRYMLYTSYRWDRDRPWYPYTKDQFGASFQQKATLVASNRKSGVTFRSLYNKKEYNYNIAYETSTLTSSKFKMDWLKAPSTSMDYLVGYGAVEIRYDINERNKPASLIGYYYHPWYVPSLSVSLGAVSVDFPFPRSDKWKWNDEFIIGEVK